MVLDSGTDRIYGLDLEMDLTSRLCIGETFLLERLFYGEESISFVDQVPVIQSKFHSPLKVLLGLYPLTSAFYPKTTCDVIHSFMSIPPSFFKPHLSGTSLYYHKVIEQLKGSECFQPVPEGLRMMSKPLQG